MHVKNSGCIRSLVLIGLALFAVSLAVYWQVGDHEFLNLDDKLYVTENIHVANGISISNIMWAFTSVEATNWHPVTWLSHMLDVQLYGMDPRGHHLTNVFIHAVSSILILILFFRLTGSIRQSSFIAALFALHPMHVESVAWVAERKDVLSAFFWFLTLLFYSFYSEKRKPGIYLLTLLSFVMGLMSKPMLVTLPVVMLLLDFWPLNRCNPHKQKTGGNLLSQLKPLLKEKVPFFVCSIFSSILTIYAQKEGGAIATIGQASFQLRIENALVSYMEYIVKTVWPHDLAVLYPLPSSIPLWQAICSLLVLLFISVATSLAWRHHPCLPVGWFWFLITLLPVIGLIQAGAQSMADRYGYIPQTGLFIMAACGAAAIEKKMKYRRMVLVMVSGAVIITSTVLTWRQLGYWHDSISLYRHTLDVTSNNFLINYSLGNAHAWKGQALANKGYLDAAIQEYREALRIIPDSFEAHNNLGLALDDKGDLGNAIKEYKEAMRLNPDNPVLHNNLGLALAAKGDPDAAIKEYRTALRIKPDYSDAHNSIGNIYFYKNDPDAAIKEYQMAISINPNNVDAHNNLRNALENR